MTGKKNTSKRKNGKKLKIERPPTLAEKITDFSTGGFTDIKFEPKRGKDKPKKAGRQGR